ncbi:YheV family putative zinc ribbon protein [Martelella alba]|uniref:YheV family putative metal-binding protein n=1 Tax=Martelella alba TaxID=2590451 RepID=A0ABY2SI02_9HYPH|nr:YheV family putative zinc ribbon protein [Martelella alba]TKI04982.1 YheV family putative metal-binding protein [Martelella alba]
MTVRRKRFIAGAVCPECQSRDTLAIWRDEQDEFDNVVCVQCGFTQRQTDKTITEKKPAPERIIGIFHPE